MQLLGFPEAITIIVSKDGNYRPEAYFFLRTVLDQAFKRHKKGRKGDSSSHVSTVELLDVFRLHALKEFGPMAITVLEYWGVKNAADLGQMIFHLIEAKVLVKTESDQLSSFADALDFQKAFVLPFQPKGARLPEQAKIKVAKP
jgi:uncharacterized repeat protein (TIGR04138 family)